MDISRFETLIFDLGGVIINLDTNKTIKEFTAHNPSLTSEILLHPTALSYETGKISDEEFRTGVREIIHPSLTDEEIDRCWNAMILDIPAWRINMLRALRNSHRLFLLSNTNSIHVQRVEEEAGLHQLVSIEELFDRVYYSHKMNMRKPDTEIYEQVIRENNLTPEKTLFIDDNPHNIAGAKATGIVTIHLTDPSMLREIFNV